MSQVVKLKDLCLPDQIGKYGIPAAAEEYSEDKVRYLRISDIDDSGTLLTTDKKSVWSQDIDKYMLREGDIVFARTGNSTGRAYYHEDVNGELAYAGFLIKFGLDETKVNPKYLKYFTISQPYRMWVENLSVGSTRGNINAKTFADCPIILPSREQQDLIADALSTIDQKISLNNQINQELEAMAKTLYDYWFVQFDFPDENGKPYKSSGGKMVYNDQLKREIPEGWGVERLLDIANTGSGGTPKSTVREFYEGGKIPWINSGELNKSVITSTQNFITERGLKNSSAKIFPNKSILLAMYGATAGKVSFLTFEASTNQAICAIILNDKRLNYYLKCVIEDMYHYLVQLSSGSARDNLSQDKLRQLLIIVPDEQTINSFHRYSDGIYEKITKNLIENQELTQLRDWLLPMLMNGQVKIKK